MDQLLDNFYGAKTNCVGIGFTMEGSENNPVMFELMSELPWRAEKFSKETWVKNYVKARYGVEDKTPPAAVLLKKACKIQSGSGTPNKTKVATISKEDLQKIAETKMPDLNAASLEAAMSMVAGTARSMGIVVED